MKSMAKALVVGVLVVATQAAAADAFPQESKQYMFGQTESTYANSHPVTTTRSVSAEYRPEGWRGLPAQSTYADRHAGDLVGTQADDSFAEGSISQPE